MVPGEGPTEGGMVVGEAPGFQEVKHGRPFIGPSGNFLFTYLASLGITRDKLYITNVVKEIPLDESHKVRRPTEKEILTWATLLTVEITEVAPKAILCLGRTAVNHLMMGDHTTVDFGDNDGYYFAAWHPSFLLNGASGIEDARQVWLEQLRPFAEALA